MSEQQQKPNFYDYVNVYDFECELPGSKQKVQFKPVSTGQIKKLLTYENEKNYVVQEKALDELISSSVLTEGFDINDLYIHDRFFLIIELRKKTKGEVLEFQITCPKCKSQSLQRVSLDDLPVKGLDPSISNVVELMPGVKVHLKQMKRGDQNEIKPNFFRRDWSSSQITAEFQTLFHACSIEKIETPKGLDENIKFKDRVYFIESIPTGEYEKIRDKLEEMSFGIDLSYKIKCVKPDCDFESTTQVPVQENFFG